MAARDLQKEKSAIETFTKSYGKVPTTSSEWSVIHRLAYPTFSELPEELRSVTNETAYQTPVGQLVKSAATGQPTPTKPLTTDQQIQQNIQGYQQTSQQAQQQMKAAGEQQRQMTVGGGSFFNTLQSAIREKMGYQSAGIDKSALMESAGLTGYDTLHQSLALRGKELDSSRADLQNVITSLGDNWKAQATAVKNQYDQAAEQYKEAQSQLERVLNNLKDNEEQIHRIRLQHELDLQTKEWERSHPTIADQISIADKGLVLEDGKVLEGTDLNKGIVGGFNIKDYATDPNHEKRIASILEGIGKFESLQEVDAYIKQKYPNSPITADMISKASAKYRIPWEMLVAMMEQDSSMGTAGKGARTFNPGNVGNDDSGRLVNFGTWQAGVDAVGAWLDKHRVAKAAEAGGSQDQKDAMSIFSGTSAMTLKDVPEKRRAGVAAELNKLKEEALAAGDIEGVIKASAGGKDVDATFIQSFEKGVNTLGQLGDLQNEIKKEKTGPIVGILRSANPYDVKAQAIKAALTALTPNLARGVYGEVGVLTDNDVKLYSQTLPNLKSTEDVRKAVLAMTLRSVQRSLENKIKIAAGFGRDVSGIGPQYQEIKRQADALEASIGMTQEGAAAPVTGTTKSGLKYTITK